MPSPPRIAVVIPAHDCADTLTRAVDSVAACAAHARETMGLDLRTKIVVIDDASTDNTPAVIDALARRIDAVPHLTFKNVSCETNPGAGVARNLGSATPPRR